MKFLDALAGMDYSQNIKPQTIAAEVTGAAIDTQDYEGKIAIVVNVTKGDAAEVVTPTLTMCDTEDGTYEAADNGTFDPTALTYEDGVMVCLVEANANLRYLKPVLTPTGSTPVPVAGVVVIGKKRMGA